MPLDIFANAELAFVGPRTGASFRYTPASAAVRNQMVGMMMQSGVPDDISSEASRHLPELRVLLIRCCVVGIDGVTAHGEPVQLTHRIETVGGFPGQSVLDDVSLSLLSGGDLGSDLLDCADRIMSTMQATEDEKKTLSEL